MFQLTAENYGAAKTNTTLKDLIIRFVGNARFNKCLKTPDPCKSRWGSNSQRQVGSFQEDDGFKFMGSDWVVVDFRVDGLTHDRNSSSTLHQPFGQGHQQGNHQHTDGGDPSISAPPQCLMHEGSKLGSAHSHPKSIDQRIRNKSSSQVSQHYSHTTYRGSLRLVRNHGSTARASPQILNQGHPPSPRQAGSYITAFQRPAPARQRRQTSVHHSSSKDRGYFDRLVRHVQQGTSNSRLGAETTMTGQHWVQESNTVKYGDDWKGDPQGLSDSKSIRSPVETLRLASKSTQMPHKDSMTTTDLSDPEIPTQYRKNVRSNRPSAVYLTPTNPTNGQGRNATASINNHPPHYKDRHGSANGRTRNNDPCMPFPCSILGLLFSIVLRARGSHSPDRVKDYLDQERYRGTQQHVNNEQEIFGETAGINFQILFTLFLFFEHLRSIYQRWGSGTTGDLRVETLQRMQGVRGASTRTIDIEIIALDTKSTDLVERALHDLQINSHEDMDAPWLSSHSTAGAKPKSTSLSSCSTELSCRSPEILSRNSGKGVSWEWKGDEDVVVHGDWGHRPDTTETASLKNLEARHRGRNANAAGTPAPIIFIGDFEVKWWKKTAPRHHAPCTLKRRTGCSHEIPQVLASTEEPPSNQASASTATVASAMPNSERHPSPLYYSHDLCPTPDSSSSAPLSHDGKDNRPYLIGDYHHHHHHHHHHDLEYDHMKRRKQFPMNAMPIRREDGVILAQRTHLIKRPDPSKSGGRIMKLSRLHYCPNTTLAAQIWLCFASTTSSLLKKQRQINAEEQEHSSFSRACPQTVSQQTLSPLRDPDKAKAKTASHTPLNHSQRTGSATESTATKIRTTVIARARNVDQDRYDDKA